MWEWEHSLTSYLLAETDALIEWAKCGESVWSSVPTVLWGVGTAALAHRMLATVFRRFLFRRVPLWELVLQHLLFLWMVIYSLYFWVVFIKIIKILVDYLCEDVLMAFQEDSVVVVEDTGRLLLQQWLVWMCGAIPLAVYIHTRPRAERPPLMIWITTSHWQRREMGPYGYYLNRPLQSSTDVSVHDQALAARRVSSESDITKGTSKKKRHSKSV